MKAIKKLIPYSLLLILIIIVGIMVIERINMEPEVLFQGDYYFISQNGSAFSYNGDTTFLYTTIANIQFGHYITILCIIGVIISCLDLLFNKNRYAVSMLGVYLIISIYTVLPIMILNIFNTAIPLISYGAAFLTFQFNFSELLMITVSYIGIIFLAGYYLYKHVKKTAW